MEEILNTSLFYLMLFITIIVLIITVADVIKHNMQCELFKNIFKTSSDTFIHNISVSNDTHKAVVNSMQEMHNKVVDTHLNNAELHNKMYNIENNLKEISCKIDKLNKNQ